LHAVFGVVMAKHACRVAIQRPLELESKLLERPSVAAPRANQERLGRAAGVRPHQRAFASPQLLL
jgi:hypothetical protein